MRLLWRSPCGRPLGVHKSVWNGFEQLSVARLAPKGQSTGRTLLICSWQICPGERLNKEVEVGAYRKRESCAREGWYKTIIHEKFKAGTIKK